MDTQSHSKTKSERDTADVQTDCDKATPCNKGESTPPKPPGSQSSSGTNPARSAELEVDMAEQSDAEFQDEAMRSVDA